MGLPEYFSTPNDYLGASINTPLLSSASPKHQKNLGNILVMVEEGPNDASVDKFKSKEEKSYNYTDGPASKSEFAPPVRLESLGSQFILGLLPLTRLYSNQPPEDWVKEELLTSALLRGYSTWTTSPRYANQAWQRIQPAATVKIGKTSLSIHAYDLLLARLNKATGDTQLCFSSNPDTANCRESEVSFSKTTLAKTGHTYQLADLAKSALRISIDNFLEENTWSAPNMVFPRLSKQLDHPQAALPLLIIIRPPHISPQHVEVLLQKLSLSYGVPNFYPDPAVIGRLWQTGIEKALENLELPWVSQVGGPDLKPEHFPSSTWLLNTTLELGPESSYAKENWMLPVKLNLSYSLEEVTPPDRSNYRSNNLAHLVSYSKKIAITPDTTINGPWVIALQNSAQITILELLHQHRTSND